VSGEREVDGVRGLSFCVEKSAIEIKDGGADEVEGGKRDWRLA
jgi:hypothetical protein